jgi:hypothetical protein
MTSEVMEKSGSVEFPILGANPLITIADLKTVWVVGDRYEAEYHLGKARQLSPTSGAKPARGEGIKVLAGNVSKSKDELNIRVVIITSKKCRGNVSTRFLEVCCLRQPPSRRLLRLVFA